MYGSNFVEQHSEMLIAVLKNIFIGMVNVNLYSAIITKVSVL